MSLYKREDFINKSGTIFGRKLFLELSYDDKDHVLFTCKDIDHADGYVSFPNLYMEYTKDDPTEWTLAEEVFTSWVIWDRISKMSCTRPIITELRKQNAIRMKSKAIRRIAATSADETDKNSFAASKYLIDKNLADPKIKARQTAAQKQKEQDEALKLVTRDAELVNLRVVK